MNITETIEQHPGFVIGGLGAAALLLYLLSGSSGGTSTAAAPAANNSNATALQIATLNANAALQGKALDVNASLQGANIGAGVAAAHDAAILNADTIAATLEQHLAEIGADASIYNTNTNAAVALRNIDASTALGEQQISSQEADALGSQDVSKAQIASGVAIAGIEGDVAQHQSDNSANVESALIQGQTKAATTKSNNDLFGNILGIGASLLSFL